MAAEQIVQELRLRSAHLLFLGGGHFYRLALSSSIVQNRVTKWQELVNKVQVQAHGGRLVLVLHQDQVIYRQFLRGPKDYIDV